MVKELKNPGKTYYVCEECGYTYKEQDWAEKCQQWCRQRQSCNLEITQHGTPPETD